MRTKTGAKKPKKPKKATRQVRSSSIALVRLSISHASDCGAVEAVKRGVWETPWTGLVEEARWLSAAGDKRGRGHAWLVIRCNCIRCPALKMVRSDVLAKIEPNAKAEGCEPPANFNTTDQL